MTGLFQEESILALFDFIFHFFQALNWIGTVGDEQW